MKMLCIDLRTNQQIIYDSIEEVCKELRVTEKQVLYAINSGHKLKMCVFDIIN